MRASRSFLIATLVALGVMLAGASGAEDLERGEQLYNLCSQCHGPEGGGNPLILAPGIAGLDQWYVEKQLHNFKGGARGIHPEDIGGLRMYPMSLSLKSDEEIAAVAAYVANMPPTDPEPSVAGGDPARGKNYYTVCATCHGANGVGNEAMGAPRLYGASDWYLVRALTKYKAGVRGSNPKNPLGSAMIGMSNTLPDEQAIKDVVAYIMTLDGAE